MKNLLVGVILGLLLSGLVCYARENVVANPIVKIEDGSLGLATTKVSTPEGTYRIFTFMSGYGAAISAIKIK